VQLTAVPRRLLREEAYLQLRDAILSGTLEPGAPIRLDEVAVALDLSRTPVREALARLAHEGLIESKPQVETRVTPIVAAATQDALAVVRSMHELAVELGLPRLGNEDLTRLRKANRTFSDALRSGDADGALQADDEFHGVFVAVAQNGPLRETIERYTPLIRRAERLRFASLPGRRSVEMHGRIIRAAEAGDVAAAVRATRENWSALGEQIVRSLERRRKERG